MLEDDHVTSTNDEFFKTLSCSSKHMDSIRSDDKEPT